MRVVLTLLAALVMQVPNATAQIGALPTERQPERPVVVDPLTRRSSMGWALSLATFEAYDVLKFPDSVSPAYLDALSPFRERTDSTAASARASYGVNGRRASVSFTGNSSVGYYRADRRTLTDVGGAVSGAVALSRKTRLAGSQSISYAPYYNFSLFSSTGGGLASPGDGALPSLDLGLFTTPVYRYTTSAQISQEITARTSIGGSFTRSDTDLRERAGGLETEQASGRLSHRIGRGLGMHAGYGIVRGEYRNTDSQSTIHNIDVGLDLTREFSLTRRTKFGFSTGSALRNDSRANPIAGDHLEFRLLGSADLSHYIGRTWSLRASYRRDWQLLDGFTAPLFLDVATVGASGSMGRRVVGGVSGSYLSGTSAIETGDKRRESYTGSAYLQFAFSRWLGAYGQYRYYQTHFRASAVEGFPNQFDRSSIRAGLVMSFPTR